MEFIEQIKQESVTALGSLVNKEKFAEFMHQGFWESERKLIEKYFKTNSKIIDVGCGSGRITIPLCMLGNEVIGTDQTSEMIDIARKIGLSTNLNIGYRIGKASDINFNDEYFDYAIFSNNGLGQIPGKGERQRALSEISRVLKPGGTLILCVHQRYYLSPTLFFWSWKFLEFYFLRFLGLMIKEVDFGDLFLKEDKEGKPLKQKRFVHIAGKSKVRDCLRKAGFKIEECKKMSKLSKEDVEKRRGALGKNFNSKKSPVFYVCRKGSIPRGKVN